MSKPKPNQHNQFAPRARAWALACCGIMVAASGLLFTYNAVHADSYDDQIKALQRQNESSQTELNGLIGQASDYRDALSKLQAQINTVQAGINDNEAQQASLQQQIIDAQNQIDHERTVLATDIKSMYVDGTPSTLEILANSKNLSDFVDKQEYRTSVQNKLQDTLTKIAALQKDLQAKKDKLAELLTDLQSQQAQLAGVRSQQAQLLAYNQQQQAGFASQISANNARMVTLRAQQAAALARLTGTGGKSPVGSSIVYRNMTGPQNCGGGYEYCGYGLDDWVSDPWGLHLARECVHYVADELALRGYYIPYGLFATRGSAYQWIGTATGAGAATLVSNPQAGDVVYLPIGTLGHVAIVDAVNDDGTLHVSQMNWYSGKYNTMDLVVTSNLQFLRFHR
jgi:peptidoglycan hydrolase CwlO-like protein